MTPNAGNFHRRGAQFGALVAVALLLAACASVPPPTSRLDRAQAAVNAAVDAGAGTWAPLELGFAEDKLNSAHAALGQRHNQLASDLADESMANSELARVKAELGQQREDNKKSKDANETLRRQLLNGASTDAAAGDAQ